MYALRICMCIYILGACSDGGGVRVCVYTYVCLHTGYIGHIHSSIISFISLIVDDAVWSSLGLLLHQSTFATA